MALDIKKSIPGKKNIEDYLETAADVLESAEKDIKDTTKK